MSTRRTSSIAKCAGCGAGTILSANGVPVCADCNARLGPRHRAKRRRPSGLAAALLDERHRTLLTELSAAVGDYRTSVAELARAVAGLEIDAYEKLFARCQRYRQRCSDLSERLNQIAN